MKKLFYKVKKPLDGDILFGEDARAFSDDYRGSVETEETLKTHLCDVYQVSEEGADKTIVYFQDATCRRYTDFVAQDLIDLQLKYWKEGQKTIEEYSKAQVYYDYQVLEIEDGQDEKRLKADIEQQDDFIEWVTYPEEKYDLNRNYYFVTKEFFRDEMLYNPDNFTDDMFFEKRYLVSISKTCIGQKAFAPLIKKYNLKKIKNMEGFLVLGDGYKFTDSEYAWHSFRYTKDYLATKKECEENFFAASRIEREKQEKEKKDKLIRDARSKRDFLANIQVLLSKPVTDENAKQFNEVFNNTVLLPLREWSKELPEACMDNGINALLTSHFKNMAVKSEDMKIIPQPK